MSLRVGIDLVEVDQVKESIAVHGDRYLTRVYTDQELEDSAGDPRRLAARFAVKEATMKALDRDDTGLDWRSISVSRGPTGAAVIELRDEALRLAERREVQSIAVSLTHERDHAAAVVVMEARP
ncbi:MAG TPA: holo-ACP synthase [Solirubrobacteraceae bacterium]|nr:holo-ACP synthase [Solirubrobacteraceae bacterium]